MLRFLNLQFSTKTVSEKLIILIILIMWSDMFKSICQNIKNQD